MPSLYETVATSGEVSSSNFTTLYNASGLSAPSAGGGAVSGNLNVGGNLTVQGTTLLVGAVQLNHTLSLPNYTFPLADGVTDQVLTTDGNGNVYWADVKTLATTYTLQTATVTGGAGIDLVSSEGANDVVKLIAGSNVTITKTDESTITIGASGEQYAIQADTATGGANLTLTGSGGSTDSVKFAAGTNVSVDRTDANTITINATATPLPSGAQGNVLTYNGTGWIASSVVETAISGNRLTGSYQNSTAGVTAAIWARKNYGASTFTTGDGASVAFQVKSDSQGTKTMAAMGASYDATTPALGMSVSTDNYATKTQINKFTANDAYFNGGRLTLNFNTTGAPTLDASIIVERGTSADASLTWNETSDRWEFNNQLYVGGNLTLSHENIFINNDSTAADSFVYWKGNTNYLKWDNTNNRFQFSDQLYIEGNTTTIPAVFVRDSTTVDTGTTSRNSLKLQKRVTNAASNATDSGGTGIKFSRTSGVSGGAETEYGLIHMDYYGTTNTAEFNVAYSTDNFAEPTPNNFPGTYNLLRINPSRALFLNNAVYIDTVNNRLGINNVAPTEALDVTGNGKFSGTVNTKGYNINFTSPQAGQLVTYNGTEFVNNSLVQFNSATYRPVIEGLAGVYGRTYSGLTVGNNTGAVNYTTADGTGVLFRLDSAAQSSTQFSGVGGVYDAGGNHTARLTTSNTNYTNYQATSVTGGNTLVFGSAHGFAANDKILYAGNTANGLTINTYYYVLSTGLTTTQCQVSLTQGGAAVALTNGTGLNLNFTKTELVLTANNTNLAVAGQNVILNATNTGVAASDATIQVERGTFGDNVAIKWNESTDRWTTTVDGTNYLNIPNQNLDTTSDVTFSSVAIDGISGFNTQQTTTTSTATVNISATTRRTQKSVIEVVDNVTGDVQVLEALCFQKGGVGYLTTYGEMQSGPTLATFTTNVVSGYIRILATPASANSTTFTVVRLGMD